MEFQFPPILPIYLFKRVFIIIIFNIFNYFSPLPPPPCFLSLLSTSFRQPFFVSFSHFIVFISSVNRAISNFPKRILQTPLIIPFNPLTSPFSPSLMIIIQIYRYIRSPNAALSVCAPPRSARFGGGLRGGRTRGVEWSGGRRRCGQKETFGAQRILQRP